MNRAYKLVWNAVSNSWTVASELAKNGKKSSGTRIKLALLLASAVTAGVAHAAPAANALPTGESVASGSASFDRSVSNQLTVNQSSSKLITNWNSFDVGSNGKVTFAQPDASSIALNRVTGGSASEIFGQVAANGQLVIVNPNGITFGAGSQVSAASIIGSVLDIQDSDFNAANLLFSRGTATGSIDNQGSLTASAGSVALLAPTVKNSGSITATGGNASLINADAVDLTANDPVISTASTITGLIQHSGSITATQVSSVGGKILLTGDTSQSSSQIQVAGTLDATTNTNVNGRSIVVNGDVNLNGNSNVLDLTSTAGYSLSNGAAVNLNGASSGFSVNGTAYTVIRDVNQLQAMNSNLAGKYVLGNNIDASTTSTWNSGAGFNPVGNVSSSFAGVLDGLGHVVDGLYINRGSEDYVGLFSITGDVSLRNIGLSNVDIKGRSYAGSLIGYNYTQGVTLISNNYATGKVSAYNGAAGLLAGSETISGSTLIDNNYTNVDVSATYSLSGGIIGEHVAYGGSSIIDHSYAQGRVTAGSYTAGGLIGVNYAEGGTALLRNSYASGVVASLSNDNQRGGLIGANIGTLENSYWNTDSSGQLQAVGYSSSMQSNAVGLTDAQSRQLSSYANWDSAIDAQGGTGAAWRIYDGQTGPLLRSFLKPVTVTVNSDSKTYDGTAYAGTGGYSVSNPAASLLGSIAYGGTASGARNAGSYSISGSGLYSSQQGYDISYVDGSLTINKKLLTISATDASKEYDGKLTSAGKPVVTGRVRGDAIVGLTQSYADKNAGTGKTINVDAGYTIRDGNGGNNYDVVIVNSTAGVITPKALTISTVANSKVYDGGVTSANKPVVTGLITGDRVTGLFQQYETKTVGTDKKLIVKAGYVVNDGNSGGNYTVTEVSGNDGVITAN